MITSYATGVAVTVLVVLAWLLVQVGWRRVFAGVSRDPDALAGRIGCHGCSEETADCQKHEACTQEENP